MRLPTIHLNGTSLEYLDEEAVAAAGALRGALAALEGMTVNSRDYYPQGPDAYAEAAREHRERIERVRGVLAEVYALLDHLDEGRGDAK